MTAPSEGRSSASPPPFLTTKRTRVDRFVVDDAAFVLELLNEPLFLRFIGDKQARSLDDARRYLQEGALASYATFGWGLYRVSLRDSGEPIGLCGFVKRDELPVPDIGYAFLERFHGQGFAFESADAILQRGVSELGLKHLMALTDPSNERSGKLLMKLGFKFLEDRVILGESDASSVYELTAR